MNNNIEKCKEDFPFRVISETPTGDGFVDCVWEMPVWVVEKLEAEAKKRKITVSDLVPLIMKAALKEKKNEITEKDVKRLWVENDAICVELKDGRIGRELIRDYEPLRKATRKQLENCRVDCNGVWFDDLDEGLELSGFFSPKKLEAIF
ncbi:DUF2442 domain-containing protein [Fibrobacter sp. UWR2]|uniref:DUF2442 domain-containing protein n=1 Tax=Fibrobacter sp. UWR2 TaxID=1964352 RepID=UPI001E2DDECD|nr:DUF2442 domain-containing protein [Fibrobacter sp. UWR2]